MAIHRGIQSAVFWYVSCAPCTEAKYRKKRKQEAERGRLEREALASEIPNMYRHPSPSSTNPHWVTEIETGPVLSPRGKWKGYTGDNRVGPKTSTTQRSEGSNRPSSVNSSTNGASRDGRNDSKHDFKRYQRQDDELWGSTSTERLGFSRSWQAHGVTEPPRAYIRASDRDGFATAQRNPQINDLHPATVTKINSREEARWMFQPPPTADIMSGKSLPSRSRSDSGNSSRMSGRSAVPFSRDLSQRLVERRLRNGEHSLTSSLSQESTDLTSSDARSQQPNRATEERDFAEVNETSTNPLTLRTPALAESSDDSNESAGTVLYNPHLVPKPFEGRQTQRVASKPHLSTIMSDSTTTSDENLIHLPSDRANDVDLLGAHLSDSAASRSPFDRRSRHLVAVTKDDSLRVLQELAPASKIFKKQVVSPDDLVRASKKSARMPSQDATKDRVPDFDPEILEAWDTAESALPDWIHEHTKREVKERWSMDI